MRKPEDLKRLLLRAVPGLADDPSRLALYVDEGRIAASAGSLSFEYRYKLNLVVQDYAGDRDAVVVPLLAWIAEAQPELMARPDSQPFSFEAEILDADSVDLSITLELTERVRVGRNDAGDTVVDHVDEVAADLDRFEGVCGASLWQLFLRDDLIAHSAAHPPA